MNPVRKAQSLIMATIGAVGAAFGLGQKVQRDMMGGKVNVEDIPSASDRKSTNREKHGSALSRGRTNAYYPRPVNENAPAWKKAKYRRELRAAKKAANTARTIAGLRRASECLLEWENMRRTGHLKVARFSEWRRIFRSAKGLVLFT